MRYVFALAVVAVTTVTTLPALALAAGTGTASAVVLDDDNMVTIALSDGTKVVLYGVADTSVGSPPWEMVKVSRSTRASSLFAPTRTSCARETIASPASASDVSTTSSTSTEHVFSSVSYRENVRSSCTIARTRSAPSRASSSATTRSG